MTRIAVFGMLVVAAVGRAPADDKKDVPKELAPFQGTWKVVKAEAGGKPVPDEQATASRFTFTGDRVVMQDGKEKPRPGASFKVDPDKEPGQLTVAGKGEDEVRMIYKFGKDGRLTLCMAAGKGGLPKEFKSTAEGKEVLIVLEKVKE